MFLPIFAFFGNFTRARFFHFKSEWTENLWLYLRIIFFEMLKMTWIVLSFVPKWFWAILNVDARGHGCVSMLTHDLKFTYTEFGQFMMNGYEDQIDKAKSQNGA